MDIFFKILLVGIPIVVFSTATLAKYQREKKHNQRGEKLFGNLGCSLSFVWIIVIGISIFRSDFFSADSSSSGSSEYTIYKWSDDAQQLSNDRVKKWINLKVLEIDILEETAYIDPLFWRSIDYKEKDELIKTILIYTEVAKSKNITSFDFYNKQSGKKVAVWTKLMGVEML